MNSIFTDDLDTCIISGYKGFMVERHHVFAGARKKACEKYGFIAPLRWDLHPNGAHATWNKETKEIDLFLKKECQKHYEENIGTRDDFIKEFGKSYL